MYICIYICIYVYTHIHVYEKRIRGADHVHMGEHRHRVLERLQIAEAPVAPTPRDLGRHLQRGERISIFRNNLFQVTIGRTRYRTL